MTMLKIMLAAGMIGHAINLYCDRILSIFPNGTLKLANVRKLREDGFAAKLMEGGIARHSNAVGSTRRVFHRAGILRVCSAGGVRV